MKHKGRYVAVVEYDFIFDDSLPNARPIGAVKEMFKSGAVEDELYSLLCAEAFDPEMGELKVTQTYFDMYELQEDCL